MTERTHFNPKSFINQQTAAIRKTLDEQKAIIACSGGVDSTTSAVLTHRAVGGNLMCIFIDTNFMRLGEPERVVKTLKTTPLNLPVKLIRAQQEFMTSLKGLTDAEEKRKAFRSTFYSVLSEVAKNEGCRFLVQGTILPDVLETVGGVKTQHNVLEQMQIDAKDVYGFKLIEPLVTLIKPQVREVAKTLGIPLEMSGRQPFPGPGLSVRVVGNITPEKLDFEKTATEIVEKKLEALRPKQYFAAIIDAETIVYRKASEVNAAVSSRLHDLQGSVKVHALKAKATGVKSGSRVYGRIILIEAFDRGGRCMSLPPQTLKAIQETVIEVDDEASRVLYRLTDQSRPGKWIITVRAVETYDFLTAEVSAIPWRILRDVGDSVIDSSSNVSAVYFDITPKPPATIEFE